MLSRSLCRSWGLHWLSGVKLRAYDGSMMGVSARMMGVHRFNYDGSSPLQRAMRISLLLCRNPLVFAPPQTPPKADRHTTPAPLACRIFELSLWVGRDPPLWVGRDPPRGLCGGEVCAPQPLAHLNAHLNAVGLVLLTRCACGGAGCRRTSSTWGKMWLPAERRLPAQAAMWGGHPLLGISQPYFGLPI